MNRKRRDELGVIPHPWPGRWVLFEPWGARIGRVGLRSVAHRGVGHELADLLSTARRSRRVRRTLRAYGVVRPRGLRNRRWSRSADVDRRRGRRVAGGL